jgi:hypothetical protein
VSCRRLSPQHEWKHRAESPEAQRPYGLLTGSVPPATTRRSVRRLYRCPLVERAFAPGSPATVFCRSRMAASSFASHAFTGLAAVRKRLLGYRLPWNETQESVREITLVVTSNPEAGIGCTNRAAGRDTRRLDRYVLTGPSRRFKPVRQVMRFLKAVFGCCQARSFGCPRSGWEF